MTLLLAALLVLSLAGNVVLIWYTRKLIQNLYYGVNNIDEMQKLLNEYAELLIPLSQLENYYGDPAIDSAVANTKLVIEACRVYKKTIIENYNEENQETEEAEEAEKAQEGEKEDQFGGIKKEAARKAEATIGPIGAKLSQNTL